MLEMKLATLPQEFVGVQWTGKNTQEVLDWLKQYTDTAQYHPVKTWEEKVSQGLFAKKQVVTYSTNEVIVYESKDVDMGDIGLLNLHINDIATVDANGDLGKISRYSLEDYAIVVDIA